MYARGQDKQNRNRSDSLHAQISGCWSIASGILRDSHANSTVRYLNEGPMPAKHVGPDGEDFKKGADERFGASLAPRPKRALTERDVVRGDGHDIQRAAAAAVSGLCTSIIAGGRRAVNPASAAGAARGTNGRPVATARRQRKQVPARGSVTRLLNGSPPTVTSSTPVRARRRTSRPSGRSRTCRPCAWTSPSPRILQQRWKSSAREGAGCTAG